MHTKIRRKSQDRLTVTAKLPIGEPSREHVDVEVERVCHCVIPIIGERKRRPWLVGSAVAVMRGGRHCLVTAHHVLSRNAGKPLFYFGADGNARPLVARFLIDERHDIAAALADADCIAALSHISFLDESLCGAVGPVGCRFYASVAGYPHTASKLKDKVTLDTPMEVVSGSADELIGGIVSVRFDKKDGAWGEGGHVLARDPFGKSGGAIFGLPWRRWRS